MLKTIAFPFIAIMLIFSILAPSLMPLLGDDYDIAVLIDINEEEKNKEKESEKKFDEKKLFLNNFAFSDNMFFQNQIQSSNRYLFSNSDFKAEILLPPPRKLV